MNWIPETISRFGASIGLPALRLDKRGSLGLKISGGGSYGVIRVDGDLVPSMVVYCAMPIRGAADTTLRQALRACDFRRAGGSPLQAAIEGDQLLIATRVAQRAFTPQALEGAIDELMGAHARLGG